MDLTLYTGRMEIRTVANALLIALTTANGGIAVQPDKRALLFIGDDGTRRMPPGAYGYDLLFERSADGFVTALLKGKVTVQALVTREEP